jgi:hypothetical protein
VEHKHRCVYCEALWFCHEDCPFDGPSACTSCRDKIRQSPEVPRRVIALDDTRLLDRLAEREADRVRQMIRRRREP